MSQPGSSIKTKDVSKMCSFLQKILCQVFRLSHKRQRADDRQPRQRRRVLPVAASLSAVDEVRDEKCHRKHQRRFYFEDERNHFESKQSILAQFAFSPYHYYTATTIYNIYIYIYIICIYIYNIYI